jgi:tripartite-type tricarboxylate transporter receptor subunit TctC
VPTLDELGIKDQEAETMQGVLVPAGTPPPIVDLLQSEIARIVALPDVKDKLLVQGLEPSGMSQAEFAAYIKADIAKWKKVIEDAKIPRIGG